MYMRAFADAYDESIVLQVVGQLPWGHNIILIDRVKDPSKRLWYAAQTIQFGWSRNVLAHQIETNLHGREGKALTSFDKTLPAPQSDLAQQIIKDPYSFDFLTLAPDAQERELERALLEHLRQFLLELGSGFASAPRRIFGTGAHQRPSICPLYGGHYSRKSIATRPCRYARSTILHPTESDEIRSSNFPI